MLSVAAVSKVGFILNSYTPAEVTQIILSSASIRKLTADAADLQTHMVPCLSMSSNMHATKSIYGVLQQHYAQDPVSDYVQAAVTTAVSIHEQDLPGDILIFLTGQEECEAAVSMLEEEARRFRRAQGSSLRLMPVALYAGLPAASQLQAFEATPRGYRKV